VYMIARGYRIFVAIRPPDQKWIERNFFKPFTHVNDHTCIISKIFRHA
jgi:hypothetical protein